MNPKNEKPLLFMNVDGVLTSARTYWTPGAGPQERLDPVALRLLQTFCEKLGAEVYMASAWSSMMFRTPKDWRALFARCGADIPVVGMLNYEDTDHGDWASAMDYLMVMFPGRPHLLFEDDPVDRDHPNLIEVDAQVGLTTVHLQAAAERLAPGSELADELARLNRGFSREKVISVSVGGSPALEVHPRDAGKVLDDAGVTLASAKQ
jgi:hypothetical protein